MNDQKKALASSTLPLLPLRDLVAYPSTVLTVDVGRERSVSAVERALGTRRPPLCRRAKEFTRRASFRRGSLHCRLRGHRAADLRLPDGSVRLLLQGETRAALLRVWEDADLQLAECPGSPQRAGFGSVGSSCPDARGQAHGRESGAAKHPPSCPGNCWI